MEHFIHYVKFAMRTALFYVNCLPYFQQRNLNLEQNFCLFIRSMVVLSSFPQFKNRFCDF